MLNDNLNFKANSKNALIKFIFDQLLTGQIIFCLFASDEALPSFKSSVTDGQS